MSLEALTDECNILLAAHHFPETMGCALELYYELLDRDDKCEAQRRWLLDFIRRWDEAEDAWVMERTGHAA